MSEIPRNLEQRNLYHLTVQLSEHELRRYNRHAFVANPENFTIIIGDTHDRIGDTHDRIIDRNNLDKRDYIGGTLYLDRNEITFNTGSLAGDTELEKANREMLIQALKDWMSLLSK